eukprot:4156683-Alexandrium_andersonii.AAC.1
MCIRDRVRWAVSVGVDVPALLRGCGALLHGACAYLGCVRCSGCSRLPSESGSASTLWRRR